MALKRKILLFTSMSLLALAFAIPASASASTWTVNGGFLGEEEFVSQSYKGPFNYVISPTIGGFSCYATVTVKAEGTEEEEVTNVSVSNFELGPLISEGKEYPCKGTGRYASCTLTGQSDNVASGWNLDVSTSPAMLTASGGPLEIVEEYGPYPTEGCWYPFRDFTFLNGLEFVPTLNGSNRITEFRLKGTDQHGLPFNFGPFATASPIFGLK